MTTHNFQLRGNRLFGNSQPCLSAMAALLLTLTLGHAGNAFGSDVAQDAEQWGTTACSAAPNVLPITDLPAVTPAAVFPGAGFSTGGVALRNRGAGGISISGVKAPVKAAFIYWAVISSGAPPKPATFIKVQKQFPTVSAAVTLPGAVVGAGPPPCWPGSVITVFKAMIPGSVATGNGLYKVSLLPGAGGLTTGDDPWLTPPVLPLWDGASIVMIGGPAGIGSPTVSIYDAGLAGSTFLASTGLAYPLMLPVAAPGVRTLFDNIGADGQHGSAGATRLAIPTVSDETTVINGMSVAGPGFPGVPVADYNDSDWNGSSGLPGTELWDDTGHDITKATPPGTPMLKVGIFNGGGTPADCLTTVANVVETD